MPSLGCNYYRGYIACRPRPKTPLITPAACSEHENCDSFQSILRNHPGAEIIRMEGGR